METPLMFAANTSNSARSICPNVCRLNATRLLILATKRLSLNYICVSGNSDVLLVAVSCASPWEHTCVEEHVNLKHFELPLIDFHSLIAARTDKGSLCCVGFGMS